MKLSFATALAATVALTACGQKSETNTAAQATPAAPAANAANDMAAMGMSSDVKTGKGTGTVTAIDAAAGTVTLEHGPIPEVGWPAMTMAFKASPAIVSQVKVGEKIAFDLKLQGAAAEVTAVQKE